jgi:DNA gyrase inhibitor GyrI
VQEIDDEINALSTIKSILNTFINRINENISVKLNFEFLKDDAILKIVDSLSVTKINFKEEKSVDDLNKANKNLSKLKNVRIIHLPPVTVAASHYIGSNPEHNAAIMLEAFISESNLRNIKPDLRVFVFNNPCPKDSQDTYGYEFWVTVPEGIEVPAPLVKKQFSGGLYGAHCIKMGNFEEWQQVYEWVGNNDEYTYDRREPLGMDGCMEEHLNAYTAYQTDKSKFTQIDLLIPIKEKV